MGRTLSLLAQPCYSSVYGGGRRGRHLAIVPGKMPATATTSKSRIKCDLEKHSSLPRKLGADGNDTQHQKPHLTGLSLSSRSLPKRVRCGKKRSSGRSETKAETIQSKTHSEGGKTVPGDNHGVKPQSRG